MRGKRNAERDGLFRFFGENRRGFDRVWDGMGLGGRGGGEGGLAKLQRIDGRMKTRGGGLLVVGM